MSETKPEKLATDQEFRTALNAAIATAIRWKRTSGYNEARNAGLRGFSQELTKTFIEEMVDEEGTPLWTPAECVMVLLGTCALVAYGDLFPEKQRSLLGTIKRESSIDK
jgi:hypothetical protein